jgi:hypothetical protein
MYQVRSDLLKALVDASSQEGEGQLRGKPRVRKEMETDPVTVHLMPDSGELC